MLGNLHGPWLICTALLLLVFAVRRRERIAVEELPWVVAVVVGAALLRLLGGVWGPMHVNGQGPFWIRGALDPEVLVTYGPGYFELFHWVTRLGIVPDRAIYLTNVWLAALTPGLLYITARLLGVASRGALAAAGALALDAVSIRGSASEAYFTPIIALVASMQASLALALRARQRCDWPALAAAIAAASLFATAAARIHPVAYLPVALSPLVISAAAGRGAWRIAIVLATVCALAVAGAVLSTSGEAVTAGLQTAAKAGYSAGTVHIAYGKAVALLALLWIVHLWSRPPWLPLLALCALVARQLTHAPDISINPLWELFYDRLFWPSILLGSAALLPRRVQRSAWVPGVTAVVAIALLLPALPHLTAATTERLEYEFLRGVLRGMPPGCTLASVGRAERRVWDAPTYLLPGTDPRATPRLTIEHADDLRNATVPNDCLLYVRSSLCSSAEARGLCEAVEQHSSLERIAGRTFPAAESYIGLPYDRSEIEVVVFRVHGHKVDRDHVARDSGSDGDGSGVPITAEFSQMLFDRLNATRESDGCGIARFDTGRVRITITLRDPSGSEHRLEIASSPSSAGGWSVNSIDKGEEACGASVNSLRTILAALTTPATAGQSDTTPAAPLPIVAFGLLALAVAVALLVTDAIT
ncbi:MAG: hypothetical protein HY270_09390 [Deltaproteobacteria bacterium]|nr:hypothetical protein [Deltaproteobacteria bacterium]